MRILLIDGFHHANEIPTLVKFELQNRGHEVATLNLIDEGFGTFMSNQERLAYHEPANLITEAQIRSAELVKNSDGLFICYPMRNGVFPPHVKSWFERVFIPGVSFVFSKTGRVKRALKNLKQISIISLAESGESPDKSRTDPNRSLLRAIRMNSHIFCKTDLLYLESKANLKTEIASSIKI